MDVNLATLFFEFLKKFHLEAIQQISSTFPHGRHLFGIAVAVTIVVDIVAVVFCAHIKRTKRIGAHKRSVRNIHLVRILLELIHAHEIS